jgi:nicotinate-nucleotide--dimethylbenzimidazole phosphoribosyltransferase
MTLERPQLPADFDQTRAAARRAQPDAWRFPAEHLAGLYHAIEQRRDIRRFRPDPLPAELLRRLLGAAHAAPSVGLMQPWRFIVVQAAETKAAMQGIAQKERLAQAPHLDARALEYLDLKLEGIREAPTSICVCTDRRPGEEILGRHTIRDTDVYSTCLAIQNLWLAARAEGVGIGWVSFYDEDDVRALLGIPAHAVPVAWLCVGYPDERPTRPGLEVAGWERRTSLSEVVFDERWRATDGAPGAAAGAVAIAGTGPAAGAVAIAGAGPAAAPGAIAPADLGAAIAARDRSDELIKPLGSLGVLETLLERWAAATGAPPPPSPRAAILVLAADHGVAVHRTSLYPQRVSAQIAGAAARGESAIGVLARAQNANLLVADIGLDPGHAGKIRPAEVAPEQLRHARIANASADITLGPAMSRDQFAQAMDTGAQLAREAIAGNDADVLVLGEIGIANTTAASAVLAGLTGLSPATVCGRGAGLDAQGLERKAQVVARALAANPPNPNRPLEILRTLGGLEFAGLAGAMLAAASDRVPVLLDGFAVGVVALAATRHRPTLRDYLFAGHRSAEPAHAAVLTELGLEPLLDLRLRLGEASGAALSLGLIGLVGAVHAEMASFDAAGVDRAN